MSDLNLNSFIDGKSKTSTSSFKKKDESNSNNNLNKSNTQNNENDNSRGVKKVTEETVEASFVPYFLSQKNVTIT